MWNISACMHCVMVVDRQGGRDWATQHQYQQAFIWQWWWGVHSLGRPAITQRTHRPLWHRTCQGWCCQCQSPHCLSVCLSVRLSVCRSVCPSVCLLQSVCLSVCLLWSVSLSLCLSITVSLYVCPLLSVCLSVCLLEFLCLMIHSYTHHFSSCW